MSYFNPSIFYIWRPSESMLSGPSSSASPSTSSSRQPKLPLGRYITNLPAQSTSVPRQLSLHPLDPTSCDTIERISGNVFNQSAPSSSSLPSISPAPISIPPEQSYILHSKTLPEEDLFQCLFIKEIFEDYSRSALPSALDLSVSVPEAMASKPTSLSLATKISALKKEFFEINQIKNERPETTFCAIKLSNLLNEYLLLPHSSSVDIDAYPVVIVLQEFVFAILNNVKKDPNPDSRASQLAWGKTMIEGFKNTDLYLTYTDSINYFMQALELRFRQHFACILNIDVESLPHFGLITFEDFETIGFYQKPRSEMQMREQAQKLRNLVQEIQKPLFHSGLDSLSNISTSGFEPEFDSHHERFVEVHFRKMMGISETINYYLSPLTLESLERAKYTLARHYLNQNSDISRELLKLNASINLSELLRSSSQFFIADVFALDNLRTLLRSKSDFQDESASVSCFDANLFEFHKEIDEQTPRTKRQRSH